MGRVDRAQRAKTAVGCCRPAKAHNDLFGPTIERSIDELARAGSGGGQRVVALGTARQGKAGRKRHLDDRRVATEAPRRFHLIAERTSNHRGAIRSAEHIERSFAAVGHTDFVAVVPKLPARVANGLSDLGGGGRTAKFVDSSQNSHAARLPVAIQRDCVEIPTTSVVFRSMAVTVRIPTTMRPLAGGSTSVQIEGATLAEVLANLDAAFPGFNDRLFDETGALRKFVNVFVADDDVRYLDGLNTAVPNGETVSIIPAVAGGC